MYKQYAHKLSRPNRSVSIHVYSACICTQLQVQSQTFNTCSRSNPNPIAPPLIKCLLRLVSEHNAYRDEREAVCLFRRGSNET